VSDDPNHHFIVRKRWFIFLKYLWSHWIIPFL